jgi:hypothetical protein
LSYAFVVGGGGAGAAAGALLDPLSPLLPPVVVLGALDPPSLPPVAAGVAAGVPPTFDPVPPSAFLFDPPLYASAYQPEPFRMKLAELMSRRTASTPHEGHTFVGSSDMRCTCSKAWPQALHW